MRGGSLIREARRRAGLTQAELARRLDTAQSVVARWETGATSPSLETVQRAVRACGLELWVSIATPDDDHDRLIDDALARGPGERLDDLCDRLAAAEELASATRR